MTEKKRHQLIWRILHPLVRLWFGPRFHFQHEQYDVQGPALILSNHVTNYDPLLLALSFPNKPVYFVASEHLFRMGWVSRLINYLVAPIARRKGSNGMDTAMACMRRLRAGDRVCIFGEGETTWNGESQPIVSSTGSLVRACGAELITYRIEGGYLTAPRWGKGIRRGRMKGRIVGRYSPDELRGMNPAQITELINRDLYEDAWARQEKEKVRFRGGSRAKFIETALFLCPACKGLGTLRGEGNRVTCSCGLDLQFTEYGLFDPPQPFENMAQWDRWQHDCLLKGEYDRNNARLFEEDVALVKVQEDSHQVKPLCSGRMRLEEDCLCCGEYRFALKEISNLAIVQRRMIVFTYEGEYYELRAPQPCCMRKYLAVWKQAQQAD